VEKMEETLFMGNSARNQQDNLSEYEVEQYKPVKWDIIYRC